MALSKLANLFIYLALALAVIGLGGSLVAGKNVGIIGGLFLILIGISLVVSSIAQYMEK